MSHGSDSTRRDSRFSAGIPATLHHSSGDIPCSAHDLSRSGVLLIGDLPDSLRGPVDITLKAPSGTLEVRIAAGPVRDLPAEEEPARRAAFEFLGPDASQHDALEALISRVVEGQSPGPLESLRPGASPPEIRKALDEIPLPHKIALAVRAGVREREYLRQDNKGAVLEALARNPSLLRAEVRALVTSQFILGSTLEHIAGDARWKSDWEIQLDLACHSRVPFPVAQKILEMLPERALRQMLHRPGVQPAIRERVVRRLGRS